MDWLIRWSLEKRVVVSVFALGLCAWGVWTARELPIDVFPDLTAPTVTVITEAHGMEPTQLEAQVTFPVEQALNGARGVRRTRSETATGVAIVWVEFEWGIPSSEARRIVNERLSLVTPSLPESVDPPFLAPMTSIMGEILFLGLQSDVVGDLELRSIAENTVRRRLLSVPGVAQVSVLGGARKQYQAVLSPERLFAHGLSVDDVADALRAHNETRTAGLLDSDGSSYLVSAEGRIRSTDDIRDVPVRETPYGAVRLIDVGRAAIGGAPRVGTGGVNAKPAVILSLQKQPGVNTLELTDRLEVDLDAIESSLPAGVELQRGLFRQRDFIDVAVRNVFHALRDGAILVVIIMALFLANARATFITLTAIPLSLFATVTLLDAIGASINTMTLGGMAIAIGALVDDAVIDVENVIRRLRENSELPEKSRRSAFHVVLHASLEIRSSIAFATFIVILVFVPLFFLSGLEGRMLRPLGLSYVVSLLASLVVAVSVTPALCYFLLPRSRGVLREHEPRLARALKSAYGRILPFILRHPIVVVGPTGLMLIAALAGALLWGRSFLPDFNEGNLTITVGTLPGTRLADSTELGRAVERILLTHPEVVATSRRTGRSEGDEHAQGAESSEIEVVLAMKDRSKEQFLAALRDDLALVPGVAISIGQPISHRLDHMLSGTEASIAVKVFGPDLYTLREIAREVEAEVRSVAGAVDVAMDPQVDIPILRVRHDHESLGRLGVTGRGLSDTLQAAFSGLAVSQVFEGPVAYDLVVRLDGDHQKSVRRVGSIPVTAADGAKVPVGTVAEVTRDLGPNRITREQGARKLVVQANVADRDVGSVVEDIRERVDPLLARYPGYRVEYGGQFESAQEASRLIAILSLAVLFGIGGLLHVAFGSFRNTMFVMANLPLALIGAVGGVWLGGGTLSVASLIGFVTVFGIAARNGILLVSHYRHLLEEEHVGDLREAVLRGSRERIIPILMTAVGTALALVPLALSGHEPGNEIQAPMAVVILCGLTTSTLLNMLVVPALYVRFGKAPSRAGASEEGGAA